MDGFFYLHGIRYTVGNRCATLFNVSIGVMLANQQHAVIGVNRKSGKQPELEYRPPPPKKNVENITTTQAEKKRDSAIQQTCGTA